MTITQFPLGLWTAAALALLAALSGCRSLSGGANKPEPKRLTFIEGRSGVPLPESVWRRRYDYVGEYKDGLTRFRKGAKWGIVAQSGEEIFPAVFDYVDKFSYDGLAVLYQGDKAGLFSSDCKVYIAPEFEFSKHLQFNWGLMAAMKNGKWGLVDMSGRMVVAANYDEIIPLMDVLLTNYLDMQRRLRKNKYGYFSARMGKKWGLIDSLGRTVLPIEYDEEFYCSEDLILARKGRKDGFVNPSGQVVIPMEYDIAVPFRRGTSLVMKNGKWGSINAKGEAVVPPVYESAKQPYEIEFINYKYTDIACFNQCGKWGVLNNRGEIVLPFEYDYIYSTHGGITKVIKNGKSSYVDSLGAIAFAPPNDYSIHEFHMNLAVAKKGVYYGIVNTVGKEVAPFIYDKISADLCFRDRKRFPCFYARLNGKEGILDTAGRTVLPLVYDNIRYDVLNILIANKGGKYGLINWSELVILPLEYDYVDRINWPLFVIKKDGKHGLANIDGRIVAPAVFDSLGNFGLDYFTWIKQSGKYGFVSKSGQIIPAVYDAVGNFSEGLGAVRVNGKWGYVNEEGKLVTPCTFEKAWKYSSGLAKVMIGGKWGIVNEEGQLVAPCVFDDAECFDAGLAKVKTGGKWGCVNARGEIIATCQYDTIIHDRSRLIALLNGKYGILNLAGEVCVPFDYDKINYRNVMRNGKWGKINHRGDIVIPIAYEYISPLYDYLYYTTPTNAVSYPVENCPLFITEVDGKRGMIDHNGRTLVKPEYEAYFPNHGMEFWLRKDGKWGQVDESGEVIIPFEYEEARYGSMLHNSYEVKKDGKWGYIDSKGRVLIPFLYDELDGYLWRPGGPVNLFKRNGKMGMMNGAGEEMTPPIYDKIEAIGNDKLKVEKDGETYLIDLCGNRLPTTEASNE